MGPCRSYRKDKLSFYGYACDQDDEVGKEDEAKKPFSASKEELKEALGYINPRYSQEDVEGIIQHAVKSEAISSIIFSCASQKGYRARH